jgi:hypothetical protein
MSDQPKVTDVIPKWSEMNCRANALPEWALAKAAELLYPNCPPPGVLYVLPAPRKFYLTVIIAEALVEASKRI